MNETRLRARLEWVPVYDVLPNPLNPRKDDTIKAEEIINIIRKRGWEEPLTVYEKGKSFVVLAGHRRLFAAKQEGVKEIPVFIVGAPQTHQEEIERIASLQSGRVNWTPYEWAKLTYERWISWNRPTLSKFAKDADMSIGIAKRYITVMDYFPHDEIASKLEREVYAIAALDVLVTWLEKVKKYKPTVMRDMTEEMIRKTMLRKLESKLVPRDALNGDRFVEVSSIRDFKEFLTSTTINLTEMQDMYGVRNEGKQKSFKGYLTSIGQLRRNILEIEPTNDIEEAHALKAIEEVAKMVRKKRKALKKSS